MLALLERDDALAWLEARRHDAEAMLAAAHVRGDAGSGKTRLVSELLTRCRSRGDLVVQVAPDPTWTKVGDSAVRDAVRALAALPAAPPDAAAWGDAGVDARRGLDILLRPASAGPVLEPVARRRALAHALRWALERGAERAGAGVVVLAVDDLDYVDGTSRNAFVDLLAEPPVIAGLVVLAYSAGALPAGEPLAGEAWMLAPLSPHAFAHLLPARLAADVRPLAPLHVEQLIAWARENREAPPERLADLVARRTENLPADARLVLHALAVWGDDATSDVLRSLLPAALDVPAALARLDRAHLVTLEGRTARITHPLVRRVVFSSIPAGRKRELFTRAETLRPDAPLEVRVKQAMHGGSALEALSLLDVLSTQRAACADLPGSVSALRHALDVARRELHRGDLDDPVGAMLLFARKLAEALVAGDQWNDADGVLREALGNAPPTSEHRARLLAVLVRVAQQRSHPVDARRYLDEAMRVARQSDHSELLPMLEGLEKSLAVA